MEETLIFLQKLLDVTTGIPLTAIPLDKQSRAEFLKKIADHTSNPLFTENDSLWQQIITAKSGLFEYNLSENIFLLAIPIKVQNIILLLGPVITTHNKASSLPYTEYNTLCKIGQLLSQHTFDQTIPPVIYADSAAMRHNSLPGEDISQMR